MYKLEARFTPKKQFVILIRFELLWGPFLGRETSELRLARAFHI